MLPPRQRPFRVHAVLLRSLICFSALWTLGAELEPVDATNKASFLLLLTLTRAASHWTHPGAHMPSLLADPRREAPQCPVSKPCRVPKCLWRRPFHFQNKWKLQPPGESTIPLFIPLLLCLLHPITPPAKLGQHGKADPKGKVLVVSISSEMLVVF